jgi:hypothetical protein
VETVIIAVGLAAVALLVAWIVQRRTGPARPTRTGYHVPDRIDRRDFDRPEAPWLVAVFTSSTCSSCAAVWQMARELASDDVAVQEAEVTDRADLHTRYRIDGVPAVVIADDEGVVGASFLGPVTAADLWATLAELREPTSG